MTLLPEQEQHDFARNDPFRSFRPEAAEAGVEESFSEREDSSISKWRRMLRFQRDFSTYRNDGPERRLNHKGTEGEKVKVKAKASRLRRHFGPDRLPAGEEWRASIRPVS